MACTGPLGAACMCSTLVRQDLCDILYLDDGHTLIVVDAPAEGQADAAGVFRSLASMDVYVRARRQRQSKARFPPPLQEPVPEPGPAPVDRAS